MLLDAQGRLGGAELGHAGAFVAGIGRHLGLLQRCDGLGMAAGRIAAAPDRADATRAGIDVLVEN